MQGLRRAAASVGPSVSSTPAAVSAAAERGVSSASGSAFDSFSAGVAARLRFSQARFLHTTVASAQKTAAKVGEAASKAKAGSAAAAVTFTRLQDVPLPAPDTERSFDFTKPLVPRHQLLYTAPARDPANRWAPTSRRVGVLGLKCGMTADWDVWGVRHPLTVVRLEHVIVTDVITEATRGYTALQVGAGLPKAKNVPKPQLGCFATKGVAPRATLSEFRVTPDALLPIGTEIDVRHFLPGQGVNVQGVTQGKGFQGVMKRWGFAGQGASHGNSVSHRVHGSTGCRHDPGRVAKGKKMAGRMGGDTRTVESLIVYKIDVARQLLYLLGCVPGKAGSVLRIYDAPKRTFAKSHGANVAPPFPTYTLSDSDKELADKWAAGSYLSPEEELLLDAGALNVPGYGKRDAQGQYSALITSMPAHARALFVASRSSGVTLDPATGLPAPDVMAALTAKERPPPVEWVMQPPTVDPFGIPENDEGEEA